MLDFQEALVLVFYTCKFLWLGEDRELTAMAWSAMRELASCSLCTVATSRLASVYAVNKQRQILKTRRYINFVR